MRPHAPTLHITIGCASSDQLQKCGSVEGHFNATFRVDYKKACVSCLCFHHINLFPIDPQIYGVGIYFAFHVDLLIGQAGLEILVRWFPVVPSRFRRVSLIIREPRAICMGERPLGLPMHGGSHPCFSIEREPPAEGILERSCKDQNPA